MAGPESLASVAAAFFIVAVPPDPANIAVASAAMSCGRCSGFLLGLCLGPCLAFWGLIAATGFGLLGSVFARS